MGKSAITRVIGLAAALLWLSACSPARPAVTGTTPVPQATPPLRQSGRVAAPVIRCESSFWQAPNILNPHLTQEAKDLQASRLTYEPLAATTRTATSSHSWRPPQIPSLQNGDVAADGKSVTWRLSLTSSGPTASLSLRDDVLFTYQFVSTPEVAASTTATYSAVKEVVVVDPLTVLVRFKDVNPAWSLPFVGSQA